MTNYSQNDEQEFILKFFGNISPFLVGRFLDIGAHDGESLSNTRALALAGWSGVLVEPHPVHFHKLWQLYGGHRNMTLVNGAVDSCNKGLVELKFNYEGPAYSSTLSPEKAFEFRANDYSKSFYVPVCGVQELVQFGPYQLISLDAEGMEVSILSNAGGLLKYCDLMCVETCPKSKSTIISQLKAFGFEVVRETPENLLVARA